MEVQILSGSIEQDLLLNNSSHIRCELVNTKNNISYITDDENLIEGYKNHPEIKLTKIGAGNYCVSYSEDKLEKQYFVNLANLMDFLQSYPFISWRIFSNNGQITVEEW